MPAKAERQRAQRTVLSCARLNAPVYGRKAVVGALSNSGVPPEAILATAYESNSMGTGCFASTVLLPLCLRYEPDAGL